uniref:Uncharacterized protein n=1 Tax=Arundo donax TaxID=35708 RepID=A0A0A9BZD0_ARUDO
MSVPLLLHYVRCGWAGWFDCRVKIEEIL